MKKYIYSALIIVTAVISLSIAAPKPAVVQEPGDWTLDAEFTHLQQISVKLKNEQKPARFWYLLLTITNNTGTDIGFYPNCELMTDTFHIIPASNNVPAAVFERIKKRHEAQYLFLESLELTNDKVLQGEDNAKDIAIIFPDFDPKAKAVNIFIAGLSNETVMVQHPIEKDENNKPLTVFLRKTLQLDYKLDGDPALRSELRLTYKGKQWIMR